jgi:hypothetical protein
MHPRDPREEKLLGYLLGKWQVQVEMMKLDREAQNLMDGMDDGSIRNVGQVFLEKVGSAIGEGTPGAMEALEGFLKSMGIETNTER